MAVARTTANGRQALGAFSLGNSCTTEFITSHGRRLLHNTQHKVVHSLRGYVITSQGRTVRGGAARCLGHHLDRSNVGGRHQPQGVSLLPLHPPLHTSNPLSTIFKHRQCTHMKERMFGISIDSGERISSIFRVKEQASNRQEPSLLFDMVMEAI